MSISSSQHCSSSASSQDDMKCLFGSNYTFQNQLFKLDLNTLNPKSYSFLTLGVVRSQVLTVSIC